MVVLFEVVFVVFLAWVGICMAVSLLVEKSEVPNQHSEVASTNRKDTNSPRGGRITMPITPEDFVRTWQQSSSVQEVADKLKMTYKAAAQRACSYRKRGVSLKAMMKNCGSKKLDWAKLDNLARSLVTCKQWGWIDADH